MRQASWTAATRKLVVPASSGHLLLSRTESKPYKGVGCARSIRHVLKLLEQQLQAVEGMPGGDGAAIAAPVGAPAGVAKRQGRWAAHRSLPGDCPAGTETAFAAKDRRLGGRGSLCPRQRQAPGGQRRIRDGRSEVRQILYMATLVPTRHNPLIRDFYQRLLERGKTKKGALVACLRKLLCILNAIARAQKPWPYEPQNA